ncbi:PVC-type heme-binding CxxCH protein [Roseimaritima ulvae]|uniref:Cytochrome c n=1 Tax=Roseimaritima ulvae TaxID=980254 RepID=A0A5B9R0H0_9BACT|nr:PVC-type heme-binding CxxCH protein [Roseimaritima ulvae]QEG43749.1 Cytochrome c [Roseimaritima ulvae]
MKSLFAAARFSAASCLVAILLVASAPAQSPAPAALAAAEPSTAAEVYGQGVRPTPWLSPQQQRDGFHLPEGFEIRLFASEPQIAKPLNIAHDDQGRLWITQSTRYPYPRRADPDADDDAADAVVILQDADGDGFAEQVTTFADDLNIPIGILPYGDGCLCFSIPNIWYLRDTDGDGRCDRRDKILGPFDTTRDTHGMVNALRDGGDGWIYACHGFNNQSTVAGTDGHSVTLQSGNTFRFRPDGSRIEQVTQGQVNPFGTTIDDWGYRYSADCHSKPITQLISGACYPSFGRPHDGLGFLPPMIDHLHGSTAISGIVYVSDASTWAPLRGQMISGNVMTSRLNRNHVRYHGATAVGDELPDILTSDDPWFRPVDLRFGPDGHLYVADFYNRIIGHYEVPLEHPGRDRTSGRIWQIRYTGPSSPTTTNRDDADARLLLAALRIVADDDDTAAFARRSLDDPNSHVVRQAAERLGETGSADDIPRLLERLTHVDAQDHVLRQTIRIAIAKQLRQAPRESSVWDLASDDRLGGELVDILPAVNRAEATTAMLHFLASSANATDHRDMFRLVAARVAAEQLDACVNVARRVAGDDIQQQIEWLNLIWESQNVSPANVPPALKQWADEIVEHQWQAFTASLDRNAPLIAWSSDDGKAWGQQPRPTRDGRTISLHSSILRGEAYTGTQQSEAFDAPPQIRFWLAGHNGFPDKPDQRRSFVRLVDAETNAELRRAYPPRNDTAAEVRWDMSSLEEGRRVRIECVDGDDGRAYAWLAVGDFHPDNLNSENTLGWLDDALQWTERAGLKAREPELLAVLRSPSLSSSVRLRIAQSIATLRGNADARWLLVAIDNSRAPRIAGQPDLDSIELITRLLDGDAEALQQVGRRVTTQLTTGQQQRFALQWVRGAGSVERLLAMARSGSLAADVFADEDLWQSLEPKLSDAQRTQVEAFRRQAAARPSASDERLQRLQATIGQQQGSLENGQPLYRQHCAGCHQLRGTGLVVGPQLDGAVARPAARLLEDILTPNRNVDDAFRTTSFLTFDGQVLVGLVQSETDEEVHLIDSQGQPRRLATDDIEVRQRTERSLMPSNVGELLTDQQIADLLAFLKNQ